MSTAAELLLRLNRSLGTALLIALRAVTAALIIGTLLLPANAQFWGDSWGGRQQPQQRQQPYNPFGGYWADRSGGFWGERQRESPRYSPRQRERVKEPEREEPPDYSRAPPTPPRKDATIKIVVMGD